MTCGCFRERGALSRLSRFPGRVLGAATHTRRRLRRAVLAGTLIAALLALVELVPAVGQEVEIVPDLPYYLGPGSDPVRHRLDLYLPVGHGVFPVVVFLHGGDWSSGDKNEGTLHGNVGRALAARGVGVAVANYRLSDGSGAGIVHPAHAQDTARAVAFVRAYLNARGFPPERLLLMGHDSGAHLAALVANNPRFLAEHGLDRSDVSGVIGLSGIYRIDPQDGSYASVFGADPALRQDASPIDHVGPAAPAHLLLYAETDRPGRAEEAVAMADALVASGVSAVAEAVASRDHRGIVEAIGQPGDATTARVVYFAVGGSLATPTNPPTGLPPGTRTPTATATPAPAAPPTQPPAGPGGAARPHGATGQAVLPGVGSIWWPTDPQPASVPLVVFLPDAPDYGAEAYGSWIEHLARGGSMVFVPRLGGDPAAWRSDAASALRVALGWAEASSLPSILPSGSTYAGEGAGALVAATLASDWVTADLPVPRALFLAAPRKHAGAAPGDLRRVPRDALALVVTGDEDPAASAELERALWAGLAEIPGAWRQFIVVQSDRHGTPALVAGEGWARTDGTGATTDALDWFGTWKWMDAVQSCALWRRLCDHALGDTPAQRDMGRWQDEVPVREPLVRLDVPGVIVRAARFPIVLR